MSIILLKNGESGSEKDCNLSPTLGQQVPVGCMHSTLDAAWDKTVPGVDHQEALLLELKDAELPSLLCA